MKKISLLGWTFMKPGLRWDLNTEEYSQYAQDDIPKTPSLYGLGGGGFRVSCPNYWEDDAVRVRLTIEEIKEGIPKEKVYKKGKIQSAIGYIDEDWYEFDFKYDEFELKDGTIAFGKGDEFNQTKIRITLEEIS